MSDKTSKEHLQVEHCVPSERGRAQGRRDAMKQRPSLGDKDRAHGWEKAQRMHAAHATKIDKHAARKAKRKRNKGNK